MMEGAGRRVLVTGAGGFVGRALAARLRDRGYVVRAAVRSADAEEELKVDEVAAVGDLGPHTDWTDAASGVNVVVHLAAHSHAPGGDAPREAARYYNVNVGGTTGLVRASLSAGVGRFVYLSSVKVNGERSTRPFTEADLPQPGGPYGASKWEAEQYLMKLAGKTGMQWAVLRPPLVYGPGVRANFLRLLHAVSHGVPMPFSAVDNRRSLIYLGNLVDAIVRCMEHERAANELFMVSDGEDLSTADLLSRLGHALGVNIRLLPLPVWALHLAGATLGRSSAVERLVGSLQVDSSRLRTRLSWDPPFTVDQGLEQTALWYRKAVAERR